MGRFKTLLLLWAFACFLTGCSSAGTGESGGAALPPAPAPALEETGAADAPEETAPPARPSKEAAAAAREEALEGMPQEQADRLAERLGIPVVVVSDQLADTPAAYRLLGELLGAEEQAEALAAYAADTLQEAAEMQLPEEKRVRVYYGNKEDSLETVPAGSLHGQVLDLAGAVNVADVELSSARVRISLEQLLAWDPDVIVVNGEPKASLSGSAAAAGILNDPDFAALTAVRNGAVYGAPSAPFSWIERPPGPNRIIGVRWLAGLLYPDAAAYDVDDEVREFFRLFYHVELSEEQLDWLF